MGYKITPSKCGNYITLTIIGEINRQSTIEQNIELHALGKKLDIKKFLIDVRQARNTDSIINNYESINKDFKKKEEIDRSAIVAVLVSADDHSHDFIETLAKNAGLLVKLFTGHDLAIEYLLQSHALQKPK